MLWDRMPRKEKQKIWKATKNAYKKGDIEKKTIAGKTVMELGLRQKYNINLVAIKRPEVANAKKANKDIVDFPHPGTEINLDDILMVAGADKDIASLPQE